MPAPARAGGPGLNVGKCPPPGPGACGDPISLPTGDVYEEITDYTTTGQNPLVVTRYYNSATGAPGGSFGNWRWTYDRTLDVSASEVDAYRPDGKVVYFSPNGSGGWNGVSDLDLRLTQSGSTWTLTDWDDNVETYTAAGQLTSITARNGYTQTFLYPAAKLAPGIIARLRYAQTSQPTSVTDSYGRTLTIAYNGSGRISSIATPDGLVLSYSYNNNGALVAVSYSTSPATSQTYLYENASFIFALTGIIDEDGNRFATWTYDPTYIYPRAISSQHAGGADLTTVAYNNDGSVTVTNPLGVQEVHKFQFFLASINASLQEFISICTEIDRLATATTAAAVRKFTYDSNGYVASQTDWNGNVTTYTNDAHGNELSRTLAYGTAQAETITTTWLSNFHLPSQISEGNRTFSFAYDANGELLTKTLTTAGGAALGVKGSAITKTLTPQGTWRYTNEIPGQGRPAASSGTTSTWTYTYSNFVVTSATDPDGNVTTYGYDASGALVSITNALRQETQITQHLPGGLPQKIVDPNGLLTTLGYDARNRVLSKTEAQWVTTYAYDAAGNLITLTRPDASALAFTYDAAHRLVAITDSLTNKIQYTLDAAGDATQWQVLGASGNVTQTRSYTYDAVTRLIQAIGAAGQTTIYAYDPNSNLTQVADPLGHVTNAAYDALNRVIKTTDANGGMTAFGYDNESRLNSVTDPRGLMTSYVHNGLDDVTSLGSPDTGVTAKTYDAAGNAITSTDARGDTTTYTYDALNRVTKAAFADSTSITYQYDQGTNGIGHLTAMSDPGGTTAWAYDIHGRVISKQQTSGGVTLTTSHAYNAATGQLASTTYPSGSTISYSYDADGRVSAISSLLSQIAYQPFGPATSWHQGSGASYSRTFDLDGRIVGIDLSSAGFAPESANRASPGRASPSLQGPGLQGSRLPNPIPNSDTIALAYDAANRITRIAENGLPAKTFGYDALGRVTNYTSGTTAQIYAYDLAGNRTAFTTWQSLIDKKVALTYAYDTASNRLLNIGGSWTESFSYDANGNMLTHNSPSADYTYTYNARNRRTQAYLGGGATTDVINGLGQRTVQTVVSSEFFVYDEAGHLTGSYNGSGGVIAETVWLGDLPVAMQSPAGLFYIAPDHLGAPHQIADAHGDAVWLWDHDPFGNGVPLGTFSYDLRFPGQFYDQDAKLHYNYYRDYDPNNGRYIESDPIGLGGGINTYAYVGGNPVGYIDPTGEDWYPYAEGQGTPTSTGMYIFNQGGITYVYWNIGEFNNKGYLGRVTKGSGPQTFRGIGGPELIWPSIGANPNRPVAPRPRVPAPAFSGSGTLTYGDENGYTNDTNGHLELPKVCPAGSTNDTQGQTIQPTPNVQNYTPTPTSSTSATGQPSTSNSSMQTAQSSLTGALVAPAAIPPGFAVAPVLTSPQK
jgi:RHS repeat-associated protein